MSEILVEVENGKYTVIIPGFDELNAGEERHTLRALRHGEPWRDLTGDNLVFNLAHELHETRKELAKVIKDFNNHEAV